MKHLKYGWYVIRHKWFVLVSGRKTGAPLWRLIIHDWTKFLPSEWFPYVERFYGSSDSPNVTSDFLKAFRLHESRNPHHWQHWTRGMEEGSARPMPHGFVKEMVADWIGAGRAQGKGNDVNDWYKANRKKMILHPDTCKEVESILQKW